MTDTKRGDPVAQYASPPTAVDGGARFETVVVDAKDDAVAVTAKIMAAAQDDPDEVEVIDRAHAAYADLRNAIAAADADEALSPEGRAAKLAPAFSKAGAVLQGIRRDAEENAADAERLEREVIDEDGDDVLNTENDRLFLRQQLAKMDRGWLGNRLYTVCRTPRSKWSRQDGSIVRAVLDSEDLGVPLVDEIFLRPGWAKLVEHSSNAPRVRACRDRADLLNRLAGTIQVAGTKEARKRGCSEAWEEALGPPRSV